MPKSNCFQFIASVLASGAVLALLGHSAQAEIDVKSGTFYSTWVDLSETAPGFHLQLKRTYSSRSNRTGIFGFGWCSDLETFLVRDERTIGIAECGGDRAQFFFKNGFGKNDTSQKRSTGSDEFYSSFSFPVETIIKKDGRFERKRNDGVRQIFDEKGRLHSLVDQSNHYLKMVYDSSGRLAKVARDNGDTLQISYGANKLIREATGPKGTKVSYTYDGSNLVQVRNAWGNTYQYKYDDVKNLVLISYADKTNDALSYDKKKDWVTSFSSRFGCSEKIAYNIADDNRSHSVEVKKTCQGRPTEITQFEVTGNAGKANPEPLRTELKISRETASLKTIDESGAELGYSGGLLSNLVEYDESGFVLEKAVGATRFSYQNGITPLQPRAVTVSIPAEDWRKTEVLKIKYHYDQKGSLLSASDGTGKTSFLYDQFGRLSAVAFPEGTKLVLSYDGRSSELKQVSQSGVGSFYFEYLPDGSFARVLDNLSSDRKIRLLESYRRARVLIEPVVSLRGI